MGVALKLLGNKWIYGPLIVIVILAAVYFVGKGDGTTKVETVPLPDDRPDGKKLTNGDAHAIRELSRSLHEEMKGANVNYSYVPYRDLLAMSDTLFVAVYNDFNTMYAEEEKGTLRDWIEDEGPWYAFPPAPIKELKVNILKRMNKLNLT